jgi:hypothetical protein
MMLTPSCPKRKREMSPTAAADKKKMRRMGDSPRCPCEVDLATLINDGSFMRIRDLFTDVALR